MDDERSRNEAAARTMLGLIWAKLDGQLGNVQRIAMTGAEPADAALVKKVFGLVTAELYMRRAHSGE